MMMKSIFDPVQIGNQTAKNRIFMAPLTRARAFDKNTPNIKLMSEYYAQRASAGLIISEAVAVHERGLGWLNTCGIYNDSQEAAWSMIIDKVHKNEGMFYMQLWHMGAVVHPDFIGGRKPISSYAKKMEGSVRTSPFSLSELVEPKQLNVAEIPEVQEQYLLAMERAFRAGSDGVEVHAANGFLIDQFIRSGHNKRDDGYGGSTTNRLRFLIELLTEASLQFGSNKIGIKISPFNRVWGIYDDNPFETFSQLIEHLNQFNISYVHVATPDVLTNQNRLLLDHITNNVKTKLIFNGGYDLKSAQDAISNQEADAISFGTKFISNPDLVVRFEHNLPLNEADARTYYSGGAAGYIDYPFYSQQQ